VSFTLDGRDLGDRTAPVQPTREERDVRRVARALRGVRVQLGDGWHADHFVPWVRGGQTERDNGRPLCPACNLRKGMSMEYQDGFDPDVRPFQVS